MKPILSQTQSSITVLKKSSPGFKIFSTSTFTRQNQENDYQLIFNSLRFFITYFDSEVCFFVGTATNLNFPPNQIVVWDDLNKKTLGIVLLKGNCDDLKVRKEVMIVSVNEKVLVFDVLTLRIVLSLDDCYSLLPVSLNSIGNPLNVVYLSKSNQRCLKICKIQMGNYNEEEVNLSEDTKEDKENHMNYMNYMKYMKNIKEIYKKDVNKDSKDKSYMSLYTNTLHKAILKPISKLQYVITTLFKEIYLYEVSSTGELIITVGSNNKIHVYSLLNFQLLLCFNSEFTSTPIETIAFSKSNIFFSLCFINGHIKIYSLLSELSLFFNHRKKSFAFLSNCDCFNEFEKEVLKEKTKSSTFLSKLTSLKEYFSFGIERKHQFCSAEFKNSQQHFACFFEDEGEEEVTVCLVTDSYAEKFRFDAVEGGKIFSIGGFEFNKSIESDE